MSSVLEPGIKYIEKPGDVYSSLMPYLYKAVFHGGVRSMWSSVMEVTIDMLWITGHRTLTAVFAAAPDAETGSVLG